jgi:hypothetical protein
MAAVAWVLASARPAPLFLPWNYFSFYLFTFLPPQHSLYMRGEINLLRLGDLQYGSPIFKLTWRGASAINHC